MSFTINANFLANVRPIAHLHDGSKVVFSQGKFDAWCIYHVQGTFAHAIRDVEVFKLMGKYTDQKRFMLYKDFLTIFEQVVNVINDDVVAKITATSMGYPKPGEVEFIFIFLYAGMVAEENKEKAILKKYIKRLGVHQVLIERMPAEIAANYSRGKSWRELKLECEARGFYTYNTQTQLSA
jgi:hypothetical protein